LTGGRLRFGKAAFFGAAAAVTLAGVSKNSSAAADKNVALQAIDLLTGNSAFSSLKCFSRAMEPVFRPILRHPLVEKGGACQSKKVNGINETTRRNAQSASSRIYQIGLRKP
jgi:hypothetical protein